MPPQVDLPVGTYEEALKMIGTTTPVRTSSGAVNHAMIKLFCCTSEDANPSYWDEEAPISPPSMLIHWLLPPPWEPARPTDGRTAPEVLRTSVPLPGTAMVNVSVDHEYIRNVRVGERLSMVEELVAVSPEKQSHLGPGHYLTTKTTFFVGEETVAIETGVLFRFIPRDDA